MSGIAFNGVLTDRAEIKLEPNWKARGRMCGAAPGDLQDPGLPRPTGDLRPGKAGDLDPLQGAA